MTNNKSEINKIYPEHTQPNSSETELANVNDDKPILDDDKHEKNEYPSRPYLENWPDEVSR